MNDRQQILAHLRQQSDWISHTNLRLALGLERRAFGDRMRKMCKAGLVISKLDHATYTTDDGRTVGMQMQHYKVADCPSYSLAACQVPWLGTYIAEVPRGEGVVHRCEDDGSEWYA